MENLDLGIDLHGGVSNNCINFANIDSGVCAALDGKRCSGETCGFYEKGRLCYKKQPKIERNKGIYSFIVNKTLDE